MRNPQLVVIADTLALELLRALDERGQQPLGATPHDEIGIGAGHAPIAHGKRKRPRVADVAHDAREARVEHEDADRDAVLVEAAAHAPGDHGAITLLQLGNSSSRSLGLAIMDRWHFARLSSPGDPRCATPPR